MRRANALDAASRAIAKADDEGVELPIAWLRGVQAAMQFVDADQAEEIVSRLMDDIETHSDEGNE